MPRPFELGEGERCRRCRGAVAAREVDARGWCPRCAAELARRVRIGQHVAGALVTLPFAAWIALEGVGRYLPWYAWLLPLAAAWYLGVRIGREVLRGFVAAHRPRRGDDGPGPETIGSGA